MDTDKRIIVFAPHPDDETIGCGGTIVRKIAEGFEVIIVVMTSGENALLKILGIESDPTPDELKQIRKDELLKASRVLGVPERNLMFLDFEDGTLQEHEKEAIEKTVKILEKFPADEVYFPYGGDSNPDHKATNRIVRHCLQRVGLSPVRYQYSVAQKFSRIGPFIDRRLGPLRKNLSYVDVSDFLDVKRRALREFKSQASIISDIRRKSLKSKEMFYTHN